MIECPVVAAGDALVGGASNGLAATSDAARAARVRRRIEEAVRLLDDGGVGGARELLEEILGPS